jgi:hypothetical protein
MKTNDRALTPSQVRWAAARVQERYSLTAIGAALHVDRRTVSISLEREGYETVKPKCKLVYEPEMDPPYNVD